MKLLSTTVIVFLAVILWGCPYESAVALDQKAKEKIDPELLGRWQTDSYPEDSTEIIFSKKSIYQYDISATLSDGLSGYERYKFVAFFSKVNGKSLLNVFDPAEKKYFFASTEFEDGELSIRTLSEDITKKKYTTSPGLRKFIEQLYRTDFDNYDSDTDLFGLKKIN
jgi:hypothetical protein